MADPRSGGKWLDHHHEWARASGFPTWDAWIESEEIRLGRKICGGPNAEHRPCGLYAGYRTGHPGQRRCFRHGGNARTGEDHPRWRDGKTRTRYPKLSEKMAAEFYRLVQDPELHSLADEIALTRSRMEGLVEGMTGATPLVLKKALDAAADGLEGALPAIAEAAKTDPVVDPHGARGALLLARGAVERVSAAVEALSKRIEETRLDGDRWAEFYEAADTLTDLVTADRKHRDKEYGDVTQADLYAVVTDVKLALIDTLKAVEEGRLSPLQARTFAIARFEQITGVPEAEPARGEITQAEAN